MNGGVPSADAESNPIVSVTESNGREGDYSTELTAFLSDNGE